MSDTLKLEKQIIHLMMHSREAVQTVSGSAVQLHHFSPSHQILVEALLEAEARHAQLTRLSFDTFLETRHVPTRVALVNRALFNECRHFTEGVKLDDIHALLEKKRIAYVGERSHELLQEYKKNLEKDAIFAANELVDSLKSTLDETEQSSNVTFNDIMSDEFWAQYDAERDHKKNAELSVTDCGLPEIDSVMGVGFDPETLTVICADVGGFKSTMMLNIALNIWKRHNKDVLFVGLEMPRNRLMDKIMSREARIPFDYFQKPKNVWTEQHEQKLQAAKTELRGGPDGNKGRFVLLEFGERTTVNQIKRQIEKHLTHFKPCVVVIDYIANLEPDADKRRKDRNDLEIGDMLKALLKMGKPGSVSKDGFGIVTGAQLNREALKRMKTYRGDATKYMFSSDDIQGSHQYSADATSIFVLYPDPANKNRLFVFPVKNRYGKKVYPDGSNKAALDVQPDINLIESPTNVTWKSEADNNILVKGVTPPKVIDDPWASEDEPVDASPPVAFTADEAVAAVGTQAPKAKSGDSWDDILEGTG